DRLAEKINLKRNKKKNAEFKRKIKGIYATIPGEFGDEKFVMILPKAVDDFSREGQNLKICVGGEYYVSKHINGNSFICFIRKAEEPEKSFVCCELDLTAGKIIQIHGYKNDVGGKLPAGTRAFAEKYLKAVKEYRKELKGEAI
ncbi:MAG: PcfJ domain-containing protein, partial [Clostridia bacterium]|nr:PcfJ domain-containing protein [Clostridia bacterium]